MEEGVRIALKVGHILEEEQHVRMKAKEEARLLEEERLKYEE